MRKLNETGRKLSETVVDVDVNVERRRSVKRSSKYDDGCSWQLALSRNSFTV